MQLTWFGHSAFRLDVKGAVILIDPFLDNPTFKGDKVGAAKGTTHVIVTHGHDDHLGSAADICKATDAILVANPEIGDYLMGKGVPEKRIEQFNHGGELHFDALSVAYVPAWHSSSTTVDGASLYLGNPGGVVIRAEGERTLLHMGDTGIFGDMKLIGEIYQPKIGIVPIGDRFTMGPKLAALACRRYFDFETVIPCHYETYDGSSWQGRALRGRDGRIGNEGAYPGAGHLGDGVGSRGIWTSENCQKSPGNHHNNRDADNPKVAALEVFAGILPRGAHHDLLHYAAVFTFIENRTSRETPRALASVSLKQGAGVATPSCSSHAASRAASNPLDPPRASTVIPRCSRSARMAPTPRSAPLSITVRASSSCIAQSSDCCGAKPPMVAGGLNPRTRCWFRLGVLARRPNKLPSKNAIINSDTMSPRAATLMNKQYV